LENAIKYVPAGGNVDLQVTAEDSRITLIVSDDGPDRTWRTVPCCCLDDKRDQGAPGSGLGLSLVAAVARMGQLNAQHPPGARARRFAAAAQLLRKALLPGT
jgi:signal transduction histidine kinase